MTIHKFIIKLILKYFIKSVPWRMQLKFQEKGVPSLQLMLLEKHVSIMLKIYSYLRESSQTFLVIFWPILLNLKFKKKKSLNRKMALISAKSIPGV